VIHYPLPAGIICQPLTFELAIPDRFRPREPGTGLGEMELTNATEEDESIGVSARAGGEGFGSPIENPGIDPIPNDPLLIPHPGEPGVLTDGTAAPLENPDDSASADPLIRNRR
jgi:hypothetical protein